MTQVTASWGKKSGRLMFGGLVWQFLRGGGKNRSYMEDGGLALADGLSCGVCVPAPVFVIR